MMELNKNSFFFYVLKQGGGKIDPRNIEFMIEVLKEWLPDDTNDNPDYSNEYYIGQEHYKQFLMDNLK
jgi:hypothetical protein